MDPRYICNVQPEHVQALRIDYENACRDHGLSADDATQDWGADF